MAGESPDDLAESPTVKGVELSPAPDPAAAMTARAPQVEPNTPLGPGTGPLPAEEMPPAGGASREPNTGATMPQTDIPQAGRPGLADRGGTVAGLDETSGTDETAAARNDRG